MNGFPRPLTKAEFDAMTPEESQLYRVVWLLRLLLNWCVGQLPETVDPDEVAARMREMILSDELLSGDGADELSDKEMEKVRALFDDLRYLWPVIEDGAERFGWRCLFGELILDWEAESGLREMSEMLAER